MKPPLPFLPLPFLRAPLHPTKALTTEDSLPNGTSLLLLNGASLIKDRLKDRHVEETLGLNQDAVTQEAKGNGEEEPKLDAKVLLLSRALRELHLQLEPHRDRLKNSRLDAKTRPNRPRNLKRTHFLSLI